LGGTEAGADFVQASTLSEVAPQLVAAANASA
jgi:hypothetical protein